MWLIQFNSIQFFSFISVIDMIGVIDMIDVIDSIQFNFLALFPFSLKEITESNQIVTVKQFTSTEF